MKRSELADWLQASGFSSSFYSLDLNDLPFEGYVLDKADDRWVVYFSERGHTRDIANFAHETDACDFFIQIMERNYGDARKRKLGS